MTTARIENYNGSPAIMINGIPYPPMMATIRTNFYDHMVIDKEYYRQLGLSGIKLFYLICDNEWLKPGAFDQFRMEAEALLEVVPDAYIIPRIGLSPPVSWIESHPEECVQYSNGKMYPCNLFSESFRCEIPAMYSLCSEKWREDAGNALLDTIEKIEELPYRDRVVGYFLAAGGTSEWYYIPPKVSTEGAYDDVGPAFRKCFSKFLKEKYHTIEALRKAWNDDAADFDHPRIPNIKERHYIYGIDSDIFNPPSVYAFEKAPVPPANDTQIGSFLNVNEYQFVADYFRARHLGTADSINYFGNVIKTHSPDLLVGAFYGAWGYSDYFNGGTATGVLRILDSDKVDFLAAPGVYENRQPGGFTGQREMPDSFRLRGRIFVVEEDTRTHAENTYFGDLAGMLTLEDTINVMKRDFGRNLSEDLQAWWFDQHLGGGRYKFPEVYRLMNKQQKIAAQSYQKDRCKFNEVAFIHDEESLNLASVHTTQETIELMRDYEISHIGLTGDQYFIEDLERENMPDYKLYVFLACYSLSDRKRQSIKAKLSRNHATALFLYGTGIINPDRDPQFHVANMEDLLGFPMIEDDVCIAPKFRIPKGEVHPAFQGLDRGHTYGWLDRKMLNSIRAQQERTQKSYVYPAFCVADNADDTVSRVAPYLLNGKTAVAVRDCKDYVSIYCGTKYARYDLLRSVAQFAGCHIFSFDGDVIYASRSYITIHASTTGDKTLYFPRKASPVEVYEEKCYGKMVKEIHFHLYEGETKTFAY